MSSNELERYYATIDHITKSGKVYLTLIDSKNINTRFTAIATVQNLTDRGLRVHEGKNFHFVIYVDGTWSLFWTKNQFLTIEEQDFKTKAFNEFLEIYYRQK